MSVNKYGRKGLPIDWDTIKSLWVSGKTASDIAAMFGVVQNTIETRAKRGKWPLLRKQAKLAREKTTTAPDSPDAVTMSSSSMIIDCTTRGPNETATDKEIVQRAITIGDATEFRTRVIKVNSKALKVLEDNPPTNIGEADRFAEALTKIERVGARTYGYDREAEHPIINIGVLTSSDREYDS